MAGRGRPRKAAADKTASKTVRLYPADLARLQRLMVAMRCSESEVVRRALLLMEDESGEPIPAQHMGRKIDARTNLRGKRK
jgi:hypothetical protein